MKYDYIKVKQDIDYFLSTHEDELFYLNDISLATGYSVYVIENVINKYEHPQLMIYAKSEHLIYVHKGETEKQVPEKYVERFLKQGYKLGRCEASKRAISFAAGGNPDVERCVYVHTAKEELRVPQRLAKEYYEKGYKRGRITTVWKGQKHTLETRLKMSRSWDRTKHDITGHKWVNNGKHNTLTAPEHAKYLVENENYVYGNLNTNFTSENVKKYLEKSKQTMIQKYGVDHNWKRPEIIAASIERTKGKPSWNKGKRYHLTNEAKQQFLERQYITKSRNKSFNKSSTEENYYRYLLTIHNEDDIVRQYRDERYPYACDFYIKSEDKFIECNFHWTHGEHPFDPSNEEDQKLLEAFKEKAKTSKFYQVAIDVWTIKDVEKLNCANHNKLNYEVLYYNDRVE